MFKFSEHLEKPLEIQIENNKFSCYPQSLIVKRGCEKFTLAVKPLQEKLNSEKVSEEEAVRATLQICEVMADFINVLLGSGSYEKIFANRSINFKDHQELICYIMDEVRNYCDFPLYNEYSS